MYAVAAAMSARLVSLRARLVVLACIVAGITVVGSADLTAAVAALVVAALLAAHLARRVRADNPRSFEDAPFRQRARSKRVVRLCDPDAAGRPRPRAPTA